MSTKRTTKNERLQAKKSELASEPISEHPFDQVSKAIGAPPLEQSPYITPTVAQEIDPSWLVPPHEAPPQGPGLRNPPPSLSEKPTDEGLHERVARKNGSVETDARSRRLVAGPDGNLPFTSSEPSTEAGRITYEEVEEPRYLAPRAMRIQREGAEDLIVPLYPDRTYSFGRASESTVVSLHDAVSRQHGRLSFRGDHRWVYRDLNSVNHSYLGKGEAPTEGDERAFLTVMRSSKDWVIEAGHYILLGNHRTRIIFLSEVPYGLVAGPRPKGAVSAASAELQAAIDTCAYARLNVFLLGKSGTGKTHIAREIHERGGGDVNKFFLLNCGALPEDRVRLTSQLLGHMKGSFTGADHDQIGIFQSADGGTLFLDEVEFLPPIAQDFLVDILEGTGRCAPLGAPPNYKKDPPNFLLISASKIPLSQTNLRFDLTQRLLDEAEVIKVPTLEERREDIPNFVEFFLHELKTKKRYNAEFTTDAIAYLQNMNWPGQLRDLRSTVVTVVAREAGLRSRLGINSAKVVISLNAVKEHLRRRSAGFGSSYIGPSGDDQEEPTITEVAPKSNAAHPNQPHPKLGFAGGAGSEEPSHSRELVASVSSQAYTPRKRPGDLTHHEVQAALTKHKNVKTHAAKELGVAVNTLVSLMKKFGIA